jgi:hypothetical protein
MIKKITFSFVLVFMAYIVMNGFTKNAMTNQTGAPVQASPSIGGYTGSSGDGMDCRTSCHHNAKRAVTGWITSDIPGTGYVPSTLYHITMTASSPGQTIFGFQVSPTDAIGNPRGNLQVTEVSYTKIVSSAGTSNHKFLTHYSAGTTGSTGTHTWHFDWLAPSAAIGGDVYFYAAFVSGASTSTDSTFTTSYLVHQNASSVYEISPENPIGLTLFPNPATNDFNVLFSISNRANVKILLNDMKGKQITTLMDREMTNGNYSYNYTLKGLVSSGVYFLTVTVNDKTYSKKIFVN